MTTVTTAIIVLASVTWYGDKHAGNLTASGEVFDPESFTCASYLYPLHTELTVKWGDKEVRVINLDRCDLKTDLDLSRRAFSHLEDLAIGRIQAQVIFDIGRQSQSWLDTNGEAYTLPERDYSNAFSR